MKRQHCLLAVGLAWLLVLAGCTKEIRLGSVEIDLDQSIYSSTEGTATIIGHVTDDGGELTDAGICYTTNGSIPEVNDNRHSCGAKKDIRVELSGLAKGQYRVRAYASNRVGTWYSETVAMEVTGPTTVPTVVWNTSSSSYNSSAGTASLYATVTNNGGATVTAAGFCYIKGTSGTPTTSNSKWTSNDKTNIHVDVSGLTDGTYYIRPYATNSNGTGYGVTMTMTIQRSNGGNRTINDVLGTWSCHAYDWDDGSYKDWSGLTITRINETLSGFSAPVVVDGFEGYSWEHIIGDWDQTNQCIRLKASWHQSSRTFYYNSDPSVTFYDVFYPVYTSGSNYWVLTQYSNGDVAEALLKFNSSGQLVLQAAEQPDKNGRYANGITWQIFYAQSDELYDYRESIFTNVTMTKTGSKGAQLETDRAISFDGFRQIRQR